MKSLLISYAIASVCGMFFVANTFQLTEYNFQNNFSKKENFGYSELQSFSESRMPNYQDQNLSRKITGIVLDSDSASIPGAEIVVKGTNIGVITDEDGLFSIEVPKEAKYLVISYFGTKQKEVQITDSNNYQILLEDDGKKELEEVVIYGQKIDRRSYTGALNSVSSNSRTKRPVSSVGAALDGAAPGLLVTKGSGQPGNNPEIMLRGLGSISSDSKPLIILDGAPYSGDLSSINPNDIKSVTILKDATAKAVFGARSANGVVSISSPKDQSIKNNGFNRTFRRKQLNAQYDSVKAALALLPQPETKMNIDDESYSMMVENQFASPTYQPLSTFSIDVDRAAYSNIRRFIKGKTKVPTNVVRIEEMINYFKYNYPQPAADKPFGLYSELSSAPWNAKHQLLKIGLQAKEIAKENLPPSNLVFLIDVSGSMSAANKLPLVKNALTFLVNELRPQDKVSIVVYAGAAGLVLPATPGSEKQTILEAINRLESGGSTAGGEGINLAYKVAREQLIDGGNNRVILATDGDFNVGASSDGDMQQLIEQRRKDGVFLTCLGFGMGNYKDSKLETLADKGNGNYAYIDDEKEARKVFIKEFGSTLFTVAKDVKIQIEFNPNKVAAYRLIGYENRMLNAEDFANDAIDAGEMGSGHSVTALYEIIPVGVNSEFAPKIDNLKFSTPQANKESNSNELAQIKYRYKKPDEATSKEYVQDIAANVLSNNQVSQSFKTASAVAWFGLRLRESKLVANLDETSMIEYAKSVLNLTDEDQKELMELMEDAVYKNAL